MTLGRRDVCKNLPGVKGVPILFTTEGKVIQATQSEGKLELILGECNDAEFKKALVTLSSDAPPRIDADENIRVHYDIIKTHGDVHSITGARAIEILDKRYGNFVKFAYVTEGYKFIEPKESK